MARSVTVAAAAAAAAWSLRSRCTAVRVSKTRRVPAAAAVTARVARWTPVGRLGSGGGEKNVPDESMPSFSHCSPCSSSPMTDAAPDPPRPLVLAQRSPRHPPRLRCDSGDGGWETFPFASVSLCEGEETKTTPSHSPSPTMRAATAPWKPPLPPSRSPRHPPRRRGHLGGRGRKAFLSRVVVQAHDDATKMAHCVSASRIFSPLLWCGALA